MGSNREAFQAGNAEAIAESQDYVFIQSFYVASSTTSIGIFSVKNFLTTAAYLGNPLPGTWADNSDGLQFDISPSAILSASTRLTLRLVYDTYDGPDKDIASQTGFGDEVDATVLSYDNQAEVQVDASYLLPGPCWAPPADKAQRPTTES